jgi:hypothetical protein
MKITHALIGLTMSVFTTVAFANSLTTECRFPVAVHIGEGIMLQAMPSSSNSNSRSVSLIETYGDQEGQKIAEFEADDLDRGTVVKAKSKNGNRLWTMTVISEVKDLGTWTSNAFLKEPAKSCAASADLNSSASEVEIRLEQNGQNTRTVKTILYCESRGGYHGYWGQGDCKIAD